MTSPDRHSALEVWLDYLTQLHPQAMALGLERIETLAAELGLTRLPCKVITVAGTNGKGTTCALMEQVLLAQGYGVGVYSSPHVRHFTERVRINGQDLPASAYCQAFAVVNQQRGLRPLTFFEFVTLAALWLFREASLDVVLLEVGLGGRLDATNATASDVAVVTTIDLDHCHILGTTREAIGAEKAGIFRSGCPAICGEPNPPLSIAAAAAACGALFCHVGVDNQAERQGDRFDYHGRQHWNDLPVPSLPYPNALTALTALDYLGLPLEVAAIRRGLAQAQLQGRLQQLRTQPAVWLDVAHNPHSAQYLASQLPRLTAGGRWLAVVGMLQDKDMAGTLAALVPHIAQWYVGGLAGERGASGEMLQQALPAGVAAQCYDSVAMAYQQALHDAQLADQLIVFGSFHTVAAVLELEASV